MNLLKRLQVSSRRRVEFHTRNKSRDETRIVISVTPNGRDAAPVSRPEPDLFTYTVRKLAA